MGPVVALNIPIGQWLVKALESGSVILECKDDPYESRGVKDMLKKMFEKYTLI